MFNLRSLHPFQDPRSVDQEWYRKAHRTIPTVMEELQNPLPPGGHQKLVPACLPSERLSISKGTDGVAVGVRTSLFPRAGEELPFG
ncbi:uncharacterized protein RCO7_14273 [Rhynchosporium graminicola]|uniref:Uncharacterized protein n=1 Tax=Rhynchosporium graminicola TaxID=2792576 RepID=A0A1E1K9M1_9HELO|nr:uncharacterized protein RCO7_14273 [Rhynchosporium commune]